jgi:hypothetical protein
MIQRLVPRDERELSVDLAADRLSYLVVSFGLLGIVAWRSFAKDEAPWDLLTLVIVSGISGTLYRVWRGAASSRWLVVGFVAVAIALVVALVISLGLAR